MINERSISVVIPTYQRHEEVIRAIRSALSQTLHPLEVIVVNDGPDAEKARLIGELSEPSVRFLEAPRRKNASATRNFGIRQAKGNWIALLDDDDIWLPKKLAAQFEALDKSGKAEAVIAGVEAVFSNEKFLSKRPRKIMPDGTPVDQILFGGAGGLHTSTLMAPARVFGEFPLDETLERHEDWDWLMRATTVVPLVVSRAVICERHLKPGEGLSRPGGFANTQSWYEKRKTLMTPKGRARFVAGILSRKAAYDGRLAAVPWIFRELWHLKPTGLKTFLLALRPWIVPSSVRRFVRLTLAR
ncbi:MAG: glycosyltransferase family 2 protein [Parvibaculum sp.]|nr:glycosyltransferase family 2 protein [Parvibaculum sp.]